MNEILFKATLHNNEFAKNANNNLQTKNLQISSDPDGFIHGSKNNLDPYLWLVDFKKYWTMIGWRNLVDNPPCWADIELEIEICTVNIENQLTWFRTNQV